jgi:hypothetical protein
MTVVYSPVPVAQNMKLTGSGERRREREGQGMRLAPVLWRWMSVENTGPKYIGR